MALITEAILLIETLQQFLKTVTTNYHYSLLTPKVYLLETASRYITYIEYLFQAHPMSLVATVNLTSGLRIKYRAADSDTSTAYTPFVSGPTEIATLSPDSKLSDTP